MFYCSVKNICDIELLQLNQKSQGKKAAVV